MIKFLSGKNMPNCVIGLGLSDENVKRLTAGHPIIVDLLELGLPWQAKVLLFHGKTEKDMEAERYAPPPRREAREEESGKSESCPKSQQT
jgi:hypothetical protein